MFCCTINERTELRQIHVPHAGELFRLAMANREYLRRWHPWVDLIHAYPDVERAISLWKEQDVNNQGFCTGIWFDGHLCGLIHHLNIDWSNRWTAFSYWLDRAHQGRGLMTAACRALIAYSFNAMKLNRVVIECATENTRSRAIPERLGFKLDGIIREGEWLHDRYVDHAFYSLLRSDWESAAKVAAANHDSAKRKPMNQPDPLPMDDFDRTLKLAFEMNNSGRSMEAEALCRVLIQVRPESVPALFLLGMVLHKEGQDEEAIKWFSVATRQQPQSANVFNGLGCAYQSLKDYSRAATAFEKALELEGPSAATCYNLGNNCFQLDQIERAAALFRQAVEMNPRDFACWNNLGKCLKELNRLDESIQAYDQAVKIAPDYGVARYGRAISLLAAGRLAEGCREFEWRWHSLTPRKFPGMAWRGETLPDKTLLLFAEQGFGDAIQMVRFVAPARARVGQVILECRPELVTLFQFSHCADAVVPAGTALPPFDCYLSLISVPHIFGITLENIRSPVPYLAAPAAAQFPETKPGQLKVGLVWAGSTTHHQDAFRSIPLADLAPILQVPGVTFYSLQKPVPDRDAAYLKSQSATVNARLDLADFLNTASVINGLDLVITVDTAVAHLAGALGKPVWVLLQHSADWRWFLDGATTPWYPTMQLFRQSTRNQWAPPIARVAGALRQLAAQTAETAASGGK